MGDSSTKREVRLEPSTTACSPQHIRVLLENLRPLHLMRASAGFHFDQADIGRRLKMKAGDRPSRLAVGDRPR